MTPLGISFRARYRPTFSKHVSNDEIARARGSAARGGRASLHGAAAAARDWLVAAPPRQIAAAPNGRLRRLRVRREAGRAALAGGEIGVGDGGR